MKITTIVLAAGLGKRMGAPIAKVLVEASGRPLISYVLETISKINSNDSIIVTGHQREAVESFILDDIKKRNLKLTPHFAHQDELLGTGHAVMCALKLIENFREGDDDVAVILCGDVPLIKSETIFELIDIYKEEKCVVNVLTFDADASSSYGRIVRDDKGNFLKIVEKKDCNEEEIKITESNSGVYCVNMRFLKDAVKMLRTNNAQKEYYLTDIVKIAVDLDLKVEASKITDEKEVQGVNTKEELEIVEDILKKAI